MSAAIYKISDLDFRHCITKTSRAIIPIGSLEQHGAHLPVSTDSLITEYIAKVVAQKIPSLFCLLFHMEFLMNINQGLIFLCVIVLYQI